MSLIKQHHNQPEDFVLPFVEVEVDINRLRVPKKVLDSSTSGGVNFSQNLIKLSDQSLEQ